jgi:Protein of unknown function (DUF1592)/Protein of unknown function (DUF1588)/Protein of unknown function (DUF1595)/Protein of unknown function (DUF1585)/Protein of unknown function (DUF1587)
MRRSTARHSNASARAGGAMAIVLGLGVAAAACTGRFSELDGDQGGARGPLCSHLQPGSSPIRRMTRFEYNSTIRDLLGDTTAPASAFVVEEEALGFNNQATALGVTQLLAEQYMEASEGIAERAARDLRGLLQGCDPAVQGADACARGFIERFGKRALRRPLTPAEIERLSGVFDWGHREYDVSTGFQLVIQALLQSPHFLYRVELGMPDPVDADVVPLSDHELASRLSYLLWGSMPDDALFAAADAGALRSPEQLAAEARRLLADPRARAAVANFHAQWLQLSHIDTLDRNATVYPDYHGGLPPLWKSETEAFLDHVVFEDEAGDVATLLTAPYSMMNAELRAFYGVGEPAAEPGPAADAFARTPLDPSRRAGFLTHASLLSVLSKPDQSSPIHRGKFVRERLLCQTLPPPPNDIDIEPPPVQPGVSTRERFRQHADDPSCSGCHAMMDPIGFGFEHYDAIGRWRDLDEGAPVDARGELTGTRDIDGAFDGAVELARRLAESEQVRQCVATQWFRFGYGRAEEEEDQCSMGQLQESFSAAGYNIQELLVALTQTDAFRYRRAVASSGGER